MGVHKQIDYVERVERRVDIKNDGGLREGGAVESRHW